MGGICQRGGELKGWSLYKGASKEVGLINGVRL